MNKLLNKLMHLFKVYNSYKGCNPAQFGREAAGNNLHQTEVMDKSKEELMEELIAELKENLVKGREQAAAKEGIAVNVLQEGGLVQEGMVSEMKDDSSWEEIFYKEEVVMDDLLEEQKQVTVEKDAKVAREEVPENEEKAEMKDTHDFDEMLVEGEVVMENVLVEGVDGTAGRNGFHKEKGSIAEFKKGDKVKHYPCKESDCGKKFSAKRNLNLHIQTVHFKEKPYHCDQSDCDEKFGQKGSLNRHMRSVHFKEKPHTCTEPSCGKKFGRRQTLTDHIRSVHFKERAYHCQEPGCGKRFAQKCNMKVHMRTVHFNEKPQGCTEPSCGKC